MQYERAKHMKRLILLAGCLAAAAANASAVYPDRLPRGEYADTESATSWGPATPMPLRSNHGDAY